MGLKKLFKQKDLTEQEGRELLEKNGVVLKDQTNYHRKKFKFGEFNKFAEQQSKNQDHSLRPVLPNMQTGSYNYSTGYEDSNGNGSGNGSGTNLDDGNTGYGYDEYAGNFKSGNDKPKSKYGNNYRYDSNDNYGNTDRRRNGNAKDVYGGNDYSNTQTRRPKINNFSSRSNNSIAKATSDAAYTAASLNTTNLSSYSNRGINTDYTNNSNGNSNSNKYGYEPSISGNKYGYEPSINNYEPANKYGYEPSIANSTIDVNNYGNNEDPGNKYGYEPSIISNKNNQVNKKSETKSEYDPYAPGEETYSKPVVETGNAYGNYDPYDSYNNDNETIKGNEGNEGVEGINNGLTGLQLQEQERGKQEENKESDYDPYGPSSELNKIETNQVDLNEYEPTNDQYGQANYIPYDNEEFEDEEEIDEDEEELNRIHRQTKEVREDTVHASRQLVDNLGQANLTANNTIGVLGSQREKLYELESNMGTMKVQQRFVDDHVKELEHYNRSLFHIKVNNPFTRNSRRKAKEIEFLNRRKEDRDAKEKLNSELYQSQRQIMGQLKDDQANSELHQKYDYDRKVKEASKYLIKDHDEEDERMEVEIATNIEAASKLANSLKQKAQAMNSEINQQNDNLTQVNETINVVDDKIAMSTRRIRGI